MRNKLELQLYAKMISECLANLTAHPLLQVNVITTSLALKVNSLTITPFGMENSPRMSRDGIVFFGCSNRLHSFDFVFPKHPSEDNENGGNGDDGTLLFVIFFNPFDVSYYIKDIEKGLGAFMKITSYDLTDNSLINIGDSYLVITYEGNSGSNLNYNSATLVIKIFNSQTQGRTLKFNPSNGVIRIGRDGNCEVAIEDSLLSKTQCAISFIHQAQGKWILSDGDGSKSSTNGTWAYIIEPAQISNNFIFKANHTLFKIVMKY